MSTTRQIIDNIRQWREAVDPDGLYSQEEFNAMTDEQKIKILVDCDCAIDDTVACPSCGQEPELRECDTCHTSAWIVDCGHKAQPRPICADDVESGRSICDGCYEARAERKRMAATLGRKGGQAKTKRKAATSAANGAKGGRPRKSEDKMATILVWGKKSADLRRDEADSVVRLQVPQSKAMVVAKAIDCCADTLGYSDANVASGHGVTIQYQSGRVREVRNRMGCKHCQQD